MQLIKTSKLPEILGLPLFSQVVFVVRRDVQWFQKIKKIESALIQDLISAKTVALDFNLSIHV